MINRVHEQATGLANRFWEKFLELEPILATVAGDERYDDQWPDPSEEGLARRKAFYEGALAELATIDQEILDGELRATLTILEFAAETALRKIAHRVDRFRAVEYLDGPCQDLATIARVQKADTPGERERYLARLAAFPAYLDAFGIVALEAAQIGQTQPLLVVERSIGQIERLLAFSPEDSPWMRPLEHAADKEKERVAEMLRKQVRPAYARYLDVLRSYREQTRESIGLIALPDGEAIYASAIENETTLSLEAHVLHELGVEQLALILEERKRTAEQLGFQDAVVAVAAHTVAGRNTSRSPDELLSLAKEQVRRAWDAAPRFFGRLPNDNCEIRPMEAFMEKDFPAAFYMMPSGDGTRRGVYWINTASLEKRQLHQLAAISFHEANPGHHLQHSIAQEFTDRLPLRRLGGSLLVGSSFIEGWGLYSERLADEMGLYQNEYERIGMFETQAWRACRLIVDTGIHAFGWSRKQAIAQMQEAGISRHEAEVEVDRYISWPGQALAYMTGQLEIQRLRRKAKVVAGARFSLKEFHDRLLSLGALPLAALRREMLAT